MILGRVDTFRVAGKALVFVDIIQDGHKLQGVCNFETLGAFGGLPAEKFRQFYHLLRRGDIVCKYLITT
jgi:lysyl-tRNA synthetase class 2